MKCQQTDLDDDHHFVKCSNASTRRLWCPTWLMRHRGVLLLCDVHAKRFEGADGTFYWDDEADRKFAEAHPSEAGKLRLSEVR